MSVYNYGESIWHDFIGSFMLEHVYTYRGCWSIALCTWGPFSKATVEVWGQQLCGVCLRLQDKEFQTLDYRTVSHIMTSNLGICSTDTENTTLPWVYLVLYLYWTYCNNFSLYNIIKGFQSIIDIMHIKDYLPINKVFFKAYRYTYELNWTTIRSWYYSNVISYR